MSNTTKEAVVKDTEDVLCFTGLAVCPKMCSPGLNPGVSNPSFILEEAKLDSESPKIALKISTLARGPCKPIKPNEVLTLHRQHCPKQYPGVHCGLFATARGLFGSELLSQV